jgi:hypothetical protein
MATIRDLLEKSRKELLDLSTRNRLLSIPVGSKSARIIQIEDEKSEQVYRLLVAEKKAFSFVPGRREKPAGADPAELEKNPKSGIEVDEEETGLPQPEEEEDRKTGLAKRQSIHDCKQRFLRMGCNADFSIFTATRGR